MSKELEAIAKIGEQIEGFKKELGDKVSKASMEEVQAALAEIKKIVESLQSEAPTEEETAAMEEELEKKMKSVNDAISKFGKQIEEIQTEMAVNKDKKSKFFGKKEFVKHEDIEKFIKDTFDGSEKTHNKASIKINSGIIFKAAEDFSDPEFYEGGTGTQRDVFTGRFVDPDLYQRKRKRNLIIDHFSIETIAVPKLYYMEKEEISGDAGSSTDVGGADWIASGVIKPKRSFRVTTGEVEAKKVAIFGTVHDKVLRDVASLETWIREDFTDEMKEAYNDALLNNNPSVNADAPLGLKQNAIVYAVTDAFDGTITEPTEIDAIVAMAAYQRSLKEQPATVFISSDLFYKIHILKDLDGRYQNNNLVYTSAAGQLYIAGIQVVDVDEEDVPSTHLLMIGAEVGFRIKNYQAMVFERGLNGEDFRYDRTSFRAYQEVLSYIPTHRENSVMYDTVANVLAAIGVPASS